MSTRGHFGFAINGERKISYNHCDSYPSGLGAEILNWLRNALVTHPGVVRLQVADLRLVDPGSEPTDDDIKRLSKFWDRSVGDTRRERPDWYQLLRETQGKPDLILSAGVMEDGSGYGGTEWEYLVDFDANELRARDIYSEKVASWPFSELPTVTEFCSALESDDE